MRDENRPAGNAAELGVLARAAEDAAAHSAPGTDPWAAAADAMLAVLATGLDAEGLGRALYEQRGGHLGIPNRRRKWADMPPHMQDAWRGTALFTALRLRAGIAAQRASLLALADSWAEQADQWENRQSRRNDLHERLADAEMAERRHNAETLRATLTGASETAWRPRIVCLCGSTRFMDVFHEANRRLSLEGAIVLTVEIATYDGTTDPQRADIQQKAALDELHLRKIDLADEVLVLNVGGYIGESTRREARYALAAGKAVRWLEPDAIPADFAGSVSPTQAGG